MKRQERFVSAVFSDVILSTEAQANGQTAYSTRAD